MRIAVLGAAGRMGRMLVAVVQQSEAAVLSGALGRPGSDRIGRDAGELAGTGRADVAIGDDLAAALDGADAILDFTTPALSVEAAGEAARRGCVHVIGTTGFDRDGEAAIESAAAETAIVKSGNMSLGVNLLAGLVEQAARALGPDAFDIEIAEMHHRHKVDAPSGTALLLGRAAAAGRGVSLDETAVMSREGHTGPRRAGDIGFATLRGGSVVGEHSVFLAGEGERIALTHQASDRAIFGRGALRAAIWAKGREPGLYSMQDVLGLSP